ncbi:TPA: hypothetical protein GRI77_24925 [Vibrio parahaemolyticus]|uniref:hypothetical protein n=1 Tax=Vibrio parahaemolyticus TaxID=670 RepID=UPI00079FE140|nr:hypothetical protein [Vibrio parahaemolyticus]EGQ9353914.1 hypothetical protein [Vibrio parahaemolyticus]EGQ9517521.1 hypothetical protein [Vibrio parahaemolyticus]EIM7932954.1 hypothetical protein [Vibrio parahaemolyticus]EJQ8021079.1 hypothetical protein [Vibrio parahaemolyticus]EJU8978896.1 hypothetical protein [Vibrio parahaemolyticus]
MELKLVYFKNIIKDSTINDSFENLNLHGLSLSTYDRSGRSDASLSDFFSQIFVMLSPALVHAVATGLLTNVVYDAIKLQLLALSRDVKGKSYQQISASGKVETIDADFGIRFRAGYDSFDLKISPNASDEVKLHCIDRAFDIIRENGVQKEFSEDYSLNSKERVGFFDEETEKYELVDILELIVALKESGRL